MKSSSPQPTPEQRQLDELQIERGRELRVENARATTRAFSDAIQARQKLRGIFSVLEGGFAGFGQGTTPGVDTPPPAVVTPTVTPPTPPPTPTGPPPGLNPPDNTLPGVRLLPTRVLR